jgi:putative membrane protein
MNNHQMNHSASAAFELMITFPFVLALVLYIGGAIVSSRHSGLRKWPLQRHVCWIFGILCVFATVVGPLANQAHTNFTAHMINHLLLGMLAPLLLVLAAPMTLLLRTLRVMTARRLSRILRSWPVRIPSHPIAASILNIGGLWIVYTTELYAAMQQHIVLHLAVHIHIFIAGYFFTVSMIYIDPISHRFSFVYRSTVLVIALAGHGILSKYIYAEPPPGVPAAQAEIGGMIMYYGGDAISAVLIFILCLHWFKATQARKDLLHTSVSKLI